MASAAVDQREYLSIQASRMFLHPGLIDIPVEELHPVDVKTHFVAQQTLIVMIEEVSKAAEPLDASPELRQLRKVLQTNIKDAYKILLEGVRSEFSGEEVDVQFFILYGEFSIEEKARFDALYPKLWDTIERLLHKMVHHINS